MNGYIHVCLKTTFTYKCCFQANTVLPYFSISKEKHPKARRWKDKWSQISYDCLLLSLMWLNEYGVFVSSRALSDVVFSHWIRSFLLSSLMYLSVKHGMTWSRLHGAGQAILTCIDSHPAMRTIATIIIIIIIMVITAITTIINIMTISIITILPPWSTPSSSQAILTCIDSQPTMTTGPSSIIPWG